MPRANPIPLPDLPTLDRHPSWCNKAGNVDRSACVEVRAAWVAKRAGGHFNEARTTAGRVGFAPVLIQAAEVEALLRGLLPRKLIGDYRRVARAMQPDGERMGTRWSPRGGRRTLKRLGLDAPGPDHGLPPNPNRGATRQKQLGLEFDWSQRLTLEWWAQTTKRAGQRLGKGPRLAEHDVVIHRPMLVCPGLLGPFDALDPAPPTDPAGDGARLSSAQRHRLNLSLINPGYPYRKTRCQPCRAGVTRRARLLYLPLATEKELIDAGFAQHWLALRHAMAPNAPLTEYEAKLIARYAPLFSPRRLLCRHCLGLRYGKLNLKDVPLSRRSYFMSAAMKAHVSQPRLTPIKPTLTDRERAALVEMLKRAARACASPTR